METPRVFRLTPLPLVADGRVPGPEAPGMQQLPFCHARSLLEPVDHQHSRFFRELVEA
jgi:hypothetical protein